MPSQILAPVPISPSRHPLKLTTATPNLGAHLSSTLASRPVGSPDARLASPRQDDWSVPAPPPPSPVGFRPDAAVF